MPSLIDEGLRHHDAGALDRAEQCYLDAIAAEPTNAQALKLLAVLASERGNVEEAISYTEAAITLKPNVAEFRHLLGRLKMRAGAYADAQAALVKAVSLAAPQPAPLMICDLAMSHEMLGQWHEAEDLYAGVLDAHMTFKAALHGAARCVAMRGDVAAARSFYERLLVLDDRDSIAVEALVQLNTPPGS